MNLIGSLAVQYYHGEAKKKKMSNFLSDKFLVLIQPPVPLKYWKKCIYYLNWIVQGPGSLEESPLIRYILIPLIPLNIISVEMYGHAIRRVPIRNLFDVCMFWNISRSLLHYVHFFLNLQHKKNQNPQKIKIFHSKWAIIVRKQWKLFKKIKYKMKKIYILYPLAHPSHHIFSCRMGAPTYLHPLRVWKSQNTTVVKLLGGNGENSGICLVWVGGGRKLKWHY